MELYQRDLNYVFCLVFLVVVCMVLDVTLILTKFDRCWRWLADVGVLFAGVY